MSGVRVKICGIREPEHARAAAEVGADFIGMVFADASRRRVEPGAAREIGRLLGGGPAPVPDRPADGATPEAWFAANAAALDRLLEGRRPLLVGVFVDADPRVVNEAAEASRLDLVQLSGDEPWEACAAIARPVIKAVRVPAGAAADAVLDGIRPGLAALPLLDAHVDGQYGGTGRTFDWDVASGVAARLPCLLAGGLTPENVGEAVARVRPWGVDVSSGVETGGTKDPARIRAFLRAAAGSGS